MTTTPNGWGSYERLVLSKLDELSSQNLRLEEKQNKMQSELSALQVKAGIWGGLAGLIPFGLFIATRLAGT